MFLGMRSRTMHELLRWGDVEPKTTSSVERYFEHSDRATKTRAGVNSEQEHSPKRHLRIKAISSTTADFDTFPNINIA